MALGLQKTSQAGDHRVLRYEWDAKRGFVSEFRELLAESLPYWRARHAFQVLPRD